MGSALRKIQQSKKAKQKLAELMDKPEHTIVIHYSCESFYDRPDGTSPRITSVAARNLDSGQTASFSIHQVAERHRYPISEIGKHYDKLERQMLDEFYEYVRTHSGFTWLHWNMRDINYGFPAIAHRYRVLGGHPVDVPDSKLVDLSRLLLAIYGIRYIDHPRLQKLIEKNAISPRDILSGFEEASAFERGEYVKLHFSTLRKVDALADIADRTDKGALKTNSKWTDVYGVYPEAIGEYLKDHWFFVVLGVLGTLASIVGLFLYVFGS